MANHAHLELLLEYSRKNEIEKWNEWKWDNPDILIDLREANLSKVNLRFVDLSGANLSGVNLSEADLSEADLDNSILNNVLSCKTIFYKTNLCNAQIKNSSFHNSSFIEALLEGADLTNCSFNFSNLSNANLVNTKLINASLSDSILYKANLSKANLSKANLSKSNLKKSKLCQANLSEANLSEANLSEANLSWADLNCALLLNADLDDVYLENSSLIDANLSCVSLNRAFLNKANLNRVNLRNANIVFSKLMKASLVDATLIDVNLTYSNLSHANLSGANLVNSNLSHINAYKTRFKNANLNGAHLCNIANNDWDITGIRCDYIFTDEDGLKRLPKDRNFEDGEFNRRFEVLPTFEIPCHDESDLAFAATIANFYNSKVESFSGLALKAIDIQAETATYTVLKKTDLETVSAKVSDYYALKDKHLMLKGKFDYLDELHSKMIEDKTTKVVIQGDAKGCQFGHNSSLTIDNSNSKFYFFSNESEIEEIKNEIDSSNISHESKNVIWSTIKKHISESGNGIFRSGIEEIATIAKEHMSGLLIKSLPRLSLLLAEIIN